MRRHPIDKFISRKPAVGHSKYNSFRFVDTRVQFESIQHEEQFHGSMADALVPINEWVIHYQRKTNRSGL